MFSFKEYMTEISRTGRQDVRSDPEGNITYEIDVNLSIGDLRSGRGEALANEIKKAGYTFVVPAGRRDRLFTDSSIVVNDAKNPTDARNKIKKLIRKARVKAILGTLKVLEMKERTEFRLGHPRPAMADSFVEVDGLASDVWVVDRVFPRKDEADRIAGPFKKQRQALKAARAIVRETGEKLKLDPDGPDGPKPSKEVHG